MGYFPIKIRITEQTSSRFGQEIILQTPEELPSGVSFKVLETNVSNTWYINLYKEFDGRLTALVYSSEEDAKADSECEEFLETVVKTVQPGQGEINGI